MNLMKKSLTTSNRQDLKKYTCVHRRPVGAVQFASSQAITDHDDMDLYTLGEQKCALYAVIPDNDNTFNFLVSLLYAQAFQALYYC